MGEPVLLEVKRLRDALGAVCCDCSAIFNVTTCPYWHWKKSKWMHERGTKHKVVYYTFGELKGDVSNDAQSTS